MSHVGDTVSLRDPPGLATQLAVQTHRSCAWWPKKVSFLCKLINYTALYLATRWNMNHLQICITDTCNCRLAFLDHQKPYLSLECDYFCLQLGFRELQIISNFHLNMEKTTGTVRTFAFVGLPSSTGWVA
jgi:hypothetical protein